LRDAELLARAVVGAPGGGRSQLAALCSYERTRDRLSEPLFDLTERIASYQWNLTEVRHLLRQLSQAMRPEVDTLLELDIGACRSRRLSAMDRRGVHSVREPH
jgi:2-polyprenyl-6-methoxyphenol hydroxylase-like FAD-dependent oxidoreductase